MRHTARKVTPRVKDGRVQKKHRWEETPSDSDAQTKFIEIIRRAPGPGARHVVDERDVRRFIALIEDWPTLSRGLQSIVLEARDDGADGWCRYDGVIALAAWPKDLVLELDADWAEEHAAVFERIGVARDPIARKGRSDGERARRNDEADEPKVRCWFTEAMARDYVLMHIFLHELGHHLDRMRTKHQEYAVRGEEFAEAWALEREVALWPKYRAHFPRC